MLRNLVIFSLFVVAISASGEFSVLSSPKSISFKGDDALQGQYVGDVLSAAMGNDVVGDAQWPCFILKDPFGLAKGVVAVHIDGVNHINLESSEKTYELEGSSSDDSLSALSADLESRNVPVCDINFDQGDAIESFRSCFGAIEVPEVKLTKNLRPSEVPADKQFLQAISYINAAADNLHTMEKTSNFLVFRLSLQSVAKAHGENSDAMAEANALLSSALAKLSSAAQTSTNNAALVVAIADKSAAVRARRETVGADPDNKLNLAKYYGEDYPVIFNIILWFMVVFFLSLLAISYAIGAMDPGRDSIIYRMTSTRMKKDN